MLATKHDAIESAHVATRLVAGALVEFSGALPNPDPILKSIGQDQAAYRRLLVDPLVMGIRRRRIAAVLALARELAPADDPAVGAACDALLKRIDMQQLVRTFMDGAFFGYQVAELVWLPDGLLWPTPVAKPGEWFTFHGEANELRLRPGHGKVRGPLDARRFVVVGKMRSWENPYGEPDLAACFWPVAFKRAGYKWWITFAERHGAPWLVAKVPRGTSTPDRARIADKLQAMVRDAVAVLPDDTAVELLGSPSTEHSDGFEKFLRFCESEVAIALLGNNQSVQAEANQATAVAAQFVEADLRDDDAQMVAAGINEMIRKFCQVNFAGAAAPTFRFTASRVRHAALARRDTVLRAAGCRFTSQYFKRTYGLSAPDLAAPTRAPKSAPLSGPSHAGSPNHAYAMRPSSNNLAFLDEMLSEADVASFKSASAASLDAEARTAAAYRVLEAKCASLSIPLDAPSTREEIEAVDGVALRALERAAAARTHVMYEGERVPLTRFAPPKRPTLRERCVAHLWSSAARLGLTRASSGKA